MEDRTSFQPATRGEVYSIDLGQEPSIKTEPAIKLEEMVEEMGHVMLTGGEESDHSDPASDLSSQNMVVIEGRVLCQLCKKAYKNRSSLTTHLRVKHNLCGNSRAKMPCLEPGCDFRANRIARLITHLIKAHKMKFQCEKVKFQNKDDFWQWRKEAEERCRSSYCAETSTKKMVSGDIKFFLRCRRSGYVKCHPQGTGTRVARKGSMKINAVCTSFMEVIFMKDGGATVHFCRTHYGHADDGQHLRMNAEERESIRQLILEGHTASAIIATMKTRMPQHRHHLLKYSKIRNISVRQNLYMTRDRNLAGGSRLVLPGELVGEAGQDSLSLQVVKEVEVQAEEEVMSSHTLDLEPHPQAPVAAVTTQDSDNVETLQTEVKKRLNKLSCLASSVTSESTLRYLSENLGFLTDLLESESRIEVVTEPSEHSEASDQNVVLHKDIDGNSLVLLCSPRSIDDLVDKKK